MMHGNDIHNIPHGAFQDLMSLQVGLQYIHTMVTLVDQSPTDPVILYSADLVHL